MKKRSLYAPFIIAAVVLYIDTVSATSAREDSDLLNLCESTCKVNSVVQDKRIELSRSYTFTAWITTSKGGVVFSVAGENSKDSDDGILVYVDGGKVCAKIGKETYESTTVVSKNEDNSLRHFLALTVATDENKFRTARIFVDDREEVISDVKFSGKTEQKVFIGARGNIQSKVPGGAGNFDGTLEEGRLYPGSAKGQDWLIENVYKPGLPKADLETVEGKQGPKGEKGDVGDEGPQGKQGQTGERGEMGAPGEKGEPGPPGVSGVGEPGEKGQTGDKGPVGEAGPVGERGPPGEAGAKGSKGERGERGDPGAKGEIGDPGEPGLAGTPGRKGEKGPDGKVGEPGAPGDRGEQGPRGEPGTPGAVGRPGVDGKNGATGAEGAQGPPGERGATGSVGPAGERGERGPPGRNGSPGLQGPPGALGATGNRGPAGERGPRGPRGERGDTGPRGDRGIRGPRGPKGLHGAQGRKGETGDRGDIGPRGEPGSDGAAGPRGAQGLPGTLWDVSPEMISRLVMPKADEMMRKELLDHSEEESSDAFGDTVEDLKKRVETLEALVLNVLEPSDRKSVGSGRRVGDEDPTGNLRFKGSRNRQRPLTPPSY